MLMANAMVPVHSSGYATRLCLVLYLWQNCQRLLVSDVLTFNIYMHSVFVVVCREADRRREIGVMPGKDKKNWDNEKYPLYCNRPMLTEYKKNQKKNSKLFQPLYLYVTAALWLLHGGAKVPAPWLTGSSGSYLKWRSCVSGVQVRFLRHVKVTQTSGLAVHQHRPLALLYTSYTTFTINNVLTGYCLSLLLALVPWLGMAKHVGKQHAG